MDVFKIHESVMADYQSFIESFINISDDAISGKVKDELSSGKLWPHPLIQFNPSFEEFSDIDNMISDGVLHADMNKIFIGKFYHEFCQQLMQRLHLGLTKTYNQFHNNEKVNSEIVPKKFNKDTVFLWKHVQKTVGACSFEEAVRDIIKLRDLHKEMDEAVLQAYGWHEPSKYGPAINLAHDFYEVEYLPETDRIRYTISPEARKEVLKRLLLLNHEIYAEEMRAGLHGKKEKSIKPAMSGNKNQFDMKFDS